MEKCRVLEVRQGDMISGKVSRFELAQVAVAALSLPEAAGKTFEVSSSGPRDAPRLPGLNLLLLVLLWAAGV